LNLTVKVTDISRYRMTPALGRATAGQLLVCDRCHDVDEIVVAVMQILPLEEGWALCGPCSQKLPDGFHLA